MAEYITFPHAPITEALLDIRVELPKSITLEDIATFYDRVRDTFSEKQQRISFKAGIKITPDGPSAEAQTSEPDGYIFQSPQHKKLVQARLDGFTFNKLKPYSDWGSFSPVQSFWYGMKAGGQWSRAPKTLRRLTSGSFTFSIKTTPLREALL